MHNIRHVLRCDQVGNVVSTFTLHSCLYATQSALLAQAAGSHPDNRHLCNTAHNNMHAAVLPRGAAPHAEPAWSCSQATAHPVTPRATGLPPLSPAPLKGQLSHKAAPQYHFSHLLNPAQVIQAPTVSQTRAGAQAQWWQQQKPSSNPSEQNHSPQANTPHWAPPKPPLEFTA